LKKGLNKKNKEKRNQPTWDFNYLNREAITVMSSKSHQDIHPFIWACSALHKHNFSLMT